MEVWNVHFAKLKVCCIKFHHGTWGRCAHTARSRNRSWPAPEPHSCVCAPEFEHANYVYRLRAAVLHRGDSYHRGHYVAFVLAPDDVWVQYNDGDAPKRFPTDPSHLQTHARYFLYERVQEAISPRSSSPTEVGSFDYTFC